MERTNFGELFWRAVRLYPEKAAIEQGDLRLTYAELEERTQRVAGLLTRLGISRDDKVLLLFPNDYRFAECLFGTLRTGAVAVPANIKLGVDTLAYIARHSDARLLIAHADLAEKAAAVRAAVPGLRGLVVGGEAAPEESYDRLLAATPPGFATVAVDRDDPALIMFTSGSTGRPKGCILTHRNQGWQARSSARTLMLEAEDKALITGPLYHANALWTCMLPMLYVGGSMAVLPGFDPDAVLEAIHRYRATYTSGTPSMFTLLLARRDALQRYDVSTIRLLVCGSAPVPAELMRNIHRTFGCDVVESYGLTEGGANLAIPRWGVKKLGSCGLPVPEVEIRIAHLEDPGRDCAPGEVGELWTRSPANARGYYKQPEATAEKFTPDGWVRTGDLVRADEQGYIYFCGRRDDMINCGGENVYPKEVESILLAHPAVADACVVPVPHKVKGQAPVAWVVLHTPGGASEEDLKRFCLERGPAYAHPRRVLFTDRLPVSGTNKVDRKALEAEARRLLPDGLGVVP